MPFHTFDDKTMFSDCLASEKFLASCYNEAATECANDQLKRDFLNVYQDVQNCLKAVWDVMHTRGWYQLQMAHQQDINQVQQQMQQEQGILQRQAGQGFQMGMSSNNPLSGKMHTNPNFSQFRPGSN